MPIIRSGYATQRRNGSTRAYRKARAQTLAEEQLCCYCHQGERAGDPWVAAHITPHSQGGTNDRHNLRKAHTSCNLRAGATPLKNTHREGGV